MINKRIVVHKKHIFDEDPYATCSSSCWGEYYGFDFVQTMYNPSRLASLRHVRTFDITQKYRSQINLPLVVCIQSFRDPPVTNRRYSIDQTIYPPTGVTMRLTLRTIRCRWLLHKTSVYQKVVFRFTNRLQESSNIRFGQSLFLTASILNIHTF